MKAFSIFCLLLTTTTSFAASSLNRAIASEKVYAIGDHIVKDCKLTVPKALYKKERQVLASKGYRIKVSHKKLKRSRNSQYVEIRRERENEVLMFFGIDSQYSYGGYGFSQERWFRMAIDSPQGEIELAHGSAYGSVTAGINRYANLELNLSNVPECKRVE